jgi:hypothetical protein
VKRLAAVVAAMLVPATAVAHPHIWISQTVKPIAADGQYVAIDIEWRFDPESSENEIPAIDENGDGKISPRENQLLIKDTMPKLQEDGFLTWLNTGGADFRPPSAPDFTAHIETPATFTPPDWDRNAGDGSKPADDHPEVPRIGHRARNLVYTMRFTLPQPVKAFTITTFDEEDFIRVEVDKAKIVAGCMLAKHPTYKSEFVPGHPVFADRVSCKLP